MSTVAKYLRQIKASLPSLKPSQVIVVTGNEATDLDSTVSAIALAQVQQKYGDRILVPMINTDHRQVLSMRGEVMDLLGQMQVKLDDLLYLDEVCAWDAACHEPEGHAAVWLLDHNEPSLRWECRYPETAHQWPVMAIIDHHQDSGLYLNASPRIIQTAGSTCSLLVKWLAGHDRLTTMLPYLEQTIAFDTMGFTWRDTPHDHACLDKTKAWDYFNRLKTVLIDEQVFPVGELLRKDYKLYRTAGICYGISTLHLDFNQLMEKEGGLTGFLACIRQFMSEERLSLFLMTNAIYTDKKTEGYYQQIAIFGNYEQSLVSALERGGAQLEPIMQGTDHALFNQLNPAISRKQVHPIVRDYLLFKASEGS